MNKKSSTYALVFSILFPVLVMMALINLYTISKDYRAEIGTTIITLMETMERGEKVLYYFDTCFDQSLKQAVYEIGLKGGHRRSPCGQYLGYAKWNTDYSWCNPPDFGSTLNSEFLKYFTACLSNHPGESIPLSSVHININTEEGVELSAERRSDLRIDITQREEYNFRTESLSDYTRGSQSQVVRSSCDYDVNVEPGA